MIVQDRKFTESDIDELRSFGPGTLYKDCEFVDLKLSDFSPGSDVFYRCTLRVTKPCNGSFVDGRYLLSNGTIVTVDNQ